MDKHGIVYDKGGHDLKLSREQIISRSQARIEHLKQEIDDEGQYIAYIEQGGEFDDDLTHSPDPWR